MNAISHEFFQMAKVPLIPNTSKIYVADGRALSCLGIASSTVKIFSWTIPFEARILAEANHSVILGRPWLYQMDATTESWRTGEFTIEWQGERRPMLTCTKSEMDDMLKFEVNPAFKPSPLPSELLAPVSPHAIMLLSVSEDVEEFDIAFPDFPTSGHSPRVLPLMNHRRRNYQSPNC